MAASARIAKWVADAVAKTPVYDLHTHLYPASFDKLMLWGIDELLTYHYLIAETIRLSDISYDAFWKLPKPQQAEVVWQTLFVDHAPISEACRGVLTVLDKLGADTSKRDLRSIRKYFAKQKIEKYVDTVFKAANCSAVVMTNDPLDPVERGYWDAGTKVDPRFKTALRIDPLLLGWPAVGNQLRELGYKTQGKPTAGTLREIRRYLEDWIDRLKPLYVACSLSPSWRYPDASPTTKVLDECVLPVCRERNLPFAMMIGVTRQVNPQLKLAGDAVGKSDVESVHRICSANPHNKFMCTMLARENTHELAIAARKHRNLLVFGCWWFLNNPSLIEEMTRIRMETLGESFVPQHSDARVLDQIIYKWSHSRQIIAKVMTDKFTDLAATGWKVTQQEIQRTARAYLSQTFENFLDLKLPQ